MEYKMKLILLALAAFQALPAAAIDRKWAEGSASVSGATLAPSTVTISGSGEKCFSVDDPTLVVNCRTNTVTVGGNAGLAVTYGLAPGSITIVGAGGNITTASSVTASAFFGDASHLSGLPAGETNTYTSSKTIQGALLVTTGVDAASGTFTQQVSADRFQMRGSTFVASAVAGTTQLGNGAGEVVTGSSNTLIGHNAGQLISSGVSNTCLGNKACRTQTTNNTAVMIGNRAGDGYDGAGAILIGDQAGRSFTSGTRLMVIGTTQGSGNALGADNIFIGFGTSIGSNLTSASAQNTAVGGQNLQSTTANGDNACFGFQTCQNTNNYRNTYLGSIAGAGSGGTTVTNSSNVGVGYGTMAAVTWGAKNTCLGYRTCSTLTAGQGNLILGFEQEPSAPTANDELNIGGMIKGSMTASGNMTVRFGASVSTFTAGGLALGGPFNAQSRTKAQFDAITPAVGDSYLCSNCTVPYDICVATGATIGGFRAVMFSAISTAVPGTLVPKGCGVGE